MAEAYRRDAERLLLAPGACRNPLALAPGRFLALHAIELYLSAWLLRSGETPRQIRARGHDLTGRVQAALAGGLGLRKRTASHIARITEGREYLVVRYAPDTVGAVPPLNRLLATLTEVSRKASKAPSRQSCGTKRPWRPPVRDARPSTDAAVATSLLTAAPPVLAAN